MDFTDSGSSILLRRECTTSSDHGEHMGLRISSIFVVFVASFIGVMTPLVASRVKCLNLPHWLYFFARYFGSGVIIATAFIHLLFEAHANLSSPCLSNAFQSFPYAFAIALVGIFGIFLIELITKYKVSSSSGPHQAHSHGPNALASNNVPLFTEQTEKTHRRMESDATKYNQTEQEIRPVDVENQGGTDISLSIPPILEEEIEEEKSNKLQAHVSNTPSSALSIHSASTDPKLVSQVGNICLLEFGIVFHSIFVGLTVAVSGPEFTTLYPVIVFHQMFEGLGLGARLESTPWSPSNEWISWLFAIMFSITTPLGIAVGLGIRSSFELNSPRALITNGVFDAISAGILIYTSLVELMGAEFLHSDEFKQAPLGRVLGAYGWMALGAALMALLGAWA